MHRWIILSALAPLAACEAEPQLATLTEASPETVEALTGVLAAALGRASIQLGPGDPSLEPVHLLHQEKDHFANLLIFHL